MFKLNSLKLKLLAVSCDGSKLYLACMLNKCSDGWSILWLGYPSFRLLAELHITSSVCFLLLISLLCNRIVKVFSIQSIHLRLHNAMRRLT